jgi:hypothetical protein
MTTLYEQTGEKFLAELEKSKDVSLKKVEALRPLFAGGKKLKGIRKLELNFGKHTFAISGPNGSRKSRIIDAIEFGLTGQMGRLSGRGTKGLSIGQHGPHVDKVKFPDTAFVRLKSTLPIITNL